MMHCLVTAATLLAIVPGATRAAGATHAPPAPQLEPAALHTVREGLPNVAAKLHAGEPVTAVFIGGSITVGGSRPAGYVTFLERWLKDRHPGSRIEVFNAGIAGTGSEFGARRYDRDVLSRNPDLVLIEFCVNDGDSDQTVAMERMVHKTWMKNPRTDIVIFYTLAKMHLDHYRAGHLPPAASAHERVAAFYGIPTVGVGYGVAQKINAGALAWGAFSLDVCHPTDAGYAAGNEIFASALPELLRHARPLEHRLGRSITPGLVVYPPSRPAEPLVLTGEFTTAKGERARKTFPLPVPGKHWMRDPSYASDDGKPIWRLSWMPRRHGGKLQPTVGADKSQWEANAMEWLDEDASFTGANGQALFKAFAGRVAFGYTPREIGVLRFVAPETGRYAVSVRTGPWVRRLDEDKSMSLAVLKFTWKGGPGESVAFARQVKKESRGVAFDLEERLVAGEELVLVPDGNAAGGGLWTNVRILVGLIE